MTKTQRARLGGLTAAANGSLKPEIARAAFESRFRNKADKKLYYTRLAHKRWGKVAA